MPSRSKNMTFYIEQEYTIDFNYGRYNISQTLGSNPASAYVYDT